MDLGDIHPYNSLDYCKKNNLDTRLCSSKEVLEKQAKKYLGFYHPGLSRRDLVSISLLQYPVPRSINTENEQGLFINALAQGFSTEELLEVVNRTTNNSGCLESDLNIYSLALMKNEEMFISSYPKNCPVNLNSVDEPNLLYYLPYHDLKAPIFNTISEYLSQDIKTMSEVLLDSGKTFYRPQDIVNIRKNKEHLLLFLMGTDYFKGYKMGLDGQVIDVDKEDTAANLLGLALGNHHISYMKLLYDIDISVFEPEIALTLPYFTISDLNEITNYLMDYRADYNLVFRYLSRLSDVDFYSWFTKNSSLVGIYNLQGLIWQCYFEDQAYKLYTISNKVRLIDVKLPLSIEGNITSSKHSPSLIYIPKGISMTYIYSIYPGVFDQISVNLSISTVYDVEKIDTESYESESDED